MTTAREEPSPKDRTQGRPRAIGLVPAPRRTRPVAIAVRAAGAAPTALALADPPEGPATETPAAIAGPALAVPPGTDERAPEAPPADEPTDVAEPGFAEARGTEERAPEASPADEPTDVTEPGFAEARGTEERAPEAPPADELTVEAAAAELGSPAAAVAEAAIAKAQGEARALEAPPVDEPTDVAEPALSEAPEEARAPEAPPVDEPTVEAAAAELGSPESGVAEPALAEVPGMAQRAAEASPADEPTVEAAAADLGSPESRVAEPGRAEEAQGTVERAPDRSTEEPSADEPAPGAERVRRRSWPSLWSQRRRRTVEHPRETRPAEEPTGEADSALPGTEEHASVGQPVLDEPSVEARSASGVASAAADVAEPGLAEASPETVEPPSAEDPIVAAESALPVTEERTPAGQQGLDEPNVEAGPAAGVTGAAADMAERGLAEASRETIEPPPAEEPTLEAEPALPRTEEHASVGQPDLDEPTVEGGSASGGASAAADVAVPGVAEAAQRTVEAPAAEPTVEAEPAFPASEEGGPEELSGLDEPTVEAAAAPGVAGAAAGVVEPGFAEAPGTEEPAPDPSREAAVAEPAPGAERVRRRFWPSLRSRRQRKAVEHVPETRPADRLTVEAAPEVDGLGPDAVAEAASGTAEHAPPTADEGAPTVEAGAARAEASSTAAVEPALVEAPGTKEHAPEGLPGADEPTVEAAAPGVETPATGEASGVTVAAEATPETAEPADDVVGADEPTVEAATAGGRTGSGTPATAVPGVPPDAAPDSAVPTDADEPTAQVPAEPPAADEPTAQVPAEPPAADEPTARVPAAPTAEDEPTTQIIATPPGADESTAQIAAAAPRDSVRPRRAGRAARGRGRLLDLSPSHGRHRGWDRHHLGVGRWPASSVATGQAASRADVQPDRQRHGRLAIAVPEPLVFLVVAAAVLAAHAGAAVLAASRVATEGEARMTVAVLAARGTTVDPGLMTPWDRFAAVQIAAVEMLLPPRDPVDAARWACLTLGVVTVVLVWLVLRGLMLSTAATAVAVGAIGVALPVLTLHAGVSGAAPAALWLTAAALLAVSGRHKAALLIALIAVATAPLVAAALLACAAHLVMTEAVRAPHRRTTAGLLALAAVVVAVLASGSGPLAGVGPALPVPLASGFAAVSLLLLGLAARRERRLRPVFTGAAVLAVAAVVPGPSGAAAAVLAVPLLAPAVAVLAEQVGEHRRLRLPALLALVALLVAPVAVAVAGARPVQTASLAEWVATQTGPATPIAADPLDRVALLSAGVQAARLRDLGDPPVTGVLRMISLRPDGSAVPCPASLVLASTPRGSGGAPGAVCRTETPGRDDRAARARFGAALASNPQLALASGVAAALRAGEVDPRLMLTLAALTAAHRVSVSDLPNVPLDATGTPRYQARLRVFDGVSAASSAMLRTWLTAQQAPFRPSITRSGSDLLITYPVPAPAGLLPP